MKTKTFEQTIAAQIKSANSHRIYGHMIETPKTSRVTGFDPYKNWIPIWACWCNHDSPDSPCPCKDNGTMVWITKSSIFEQGRSDKKDSDGDILEYFDIDSDSKLIVQSFNNIKASELKMSECGCNKNGNTPGIMAQGMPPLNPWVIIAGAILAGIGTKAGEGAYDTIEKGLDWLFTPISFPKPQ